MERLLPTCSYVVTPVRWVGSAVWAFTFQKFVVYLPLCPVVVVYRSFRAVGRLLQAKNFGRWVLGVIFKMRLRSRSRPNMFFS